MRIDYLDGLRGIAILLVIFFHAFSRWSSSLPYGETYAKFPLFELGWLGVNLFFIISGFVIFLSLDRVDSLKTFFYKRWLRLFPAMLIASVLLYLTASFFTDRPMGQPELLSLLPGLTFVDSEWWSKILGHQIIPLEGVFWSLYVECKFYVIAGFIYYILGRKFLVPMLFGLFILSILTSNTYSVSDNFAFTALGKISSILSFEYFGWFAVGAVFYLYHQSKLEKWFILGLAMIIFNSIFVDLNNFPVFMDSLGALLISGLFAVSLKSERIQNILKNKIILFFGFISYPLYLIHENAMISMIINLSDYLPWLPSFTYPLISLAFLSLVSYIISKKLEFTLQKAIARAFSYLFNLLPFKRLLG